MLQWILLELLPVHPLDELGSLVHLTTSTRSVAVLLAIVRQMLLCCISLLLKLFDRCCEVNFRFEEFIRVKLVLNLYILLMLSTNRHFLIKNSNIPVAPSWVRLML